MVGVQDTLTWAALIAASGSIATVIKLWLDLGRMVEKAEQASSTAALLSAKVDLGASNLADFKVAVAQTYATSRALGETEAALARGMDGINLRLDKLNDRLDAVITLASRRANE